MARDEGALVALYHLLQHKGGGNSGKVRAAGGGGKREAEANQVVDGVADDGLVEVADLDFDLAVGVGYGAEVPDVAVATDPDGRALRQLVTGAGPQPFVELQGVAADVGVSRPRHLEPATLFEHCLAVGRLDCNSFLSHQPVLAENSHWRRGADDAREIAGRGNGLNRL
jgi:hypothetical protein